MQKCPNCGFEPVEGYATCPKCGFSLQLNNQEDNNNVVDDDKNDTIEWSELADMPIESVQKMFKDNEEKMKEEQSKEKAEEIPEMNPILAQYIREHKDGSEEFEKNESTAEETDVADSTKDNEIEINETIENEAAENETDEIQTAEEPSKEEESESVSPSVPESAETAPVEENAADVNETDGEAASEEDTVPETAVAETEAEKEAEKEAEETSAEADESSSEAVVPPEMPEPSNEKPKKNHKKIYIALAAIAVLGMAGGYYYQHEKEAEAQRIATVKKENKALDSIEESLDGYYTDDQHTFLAADKVSLNPTKIDEELAQYKDNKRYDELKKDYDTLVDKQKAEQSVNQLFTSAAINGGKIADKPLLKAAEPVDLTINTGDESFDKLMNQAVANAKDQYSKIEAAKKAADSLFKDGNVIDSVNRDQYNDANNAVKAVANQALVKTQKEQLAKVDQTLKDKEKKAAEEKAAAEKAAQEKAAQEKAAQAETTQASTDTSQAGDTSSDAYAWAPGVKEKVIQTCISRGYIVEGGYTLEPVKVENGEGYYNLYATSNQASLTKGYTDADLPMYLVTINCKTGWFKGNGPN